MKTLALLAFIFGILFFQLNPAWIILGIVIAMLF